MEIGKQQMNKTDNIQLKGKMKVINTDRGEQKDTFVSSCGNYDKDMGKNLKDLGKKYGSCGGYVPPSGGHYNSCGGYVPPSGGHYNSCGGYVLPSGGHYNSCGSIKPEPKPSSC